VLKEVIEVFERKYREGSIPGNKDFYITKEHIPTDGDYIILHEKDDGFTADMPVKLKMDKKTRVIETTNLYFDFIQSADYMSKYLESNKAIADKNIHSNNYLTLFVKKENLFNGKITEETLTSYYEVFKEPYKKKYSKPQLRKAYEAMEQKYGKSNREKIEKIERWVKENLFHLAIENDNSYLKLFFYYDLEEYRKESEKYIITNIYNSADYNTLIDQIIYGVPNNNMGLNSKKPFLEQKTRKNSVPVLLSQEEVLLQKKFFDYLNNMAAKGKVNLYFSEDEIFPYDNQTNPDTDFCGYFIRVEKGIEPEIHDFDIITSYSNQIRPLKIKNVLRIKSSDLEYKTVYTLSELKKIIDSLLFRNYLSKNYFNEASKIRIYDENLKKNLLLARKSLFDWFYKGIDDDIWEVLKRSCLDLTKGSIYMGELWKDGGRARELFNIYISLMYYFEGRELVDNSLLDVEKLREKINQKKTGQLDSDEEYYFAVGQLTNYFLTLSKAKVKSHFLSKPILTSKSNEKIRSELKKLYFKYMYDIKLGKRFHNLYGMVCTYIVQNQEVNEDALLAGFLHSSLIYEVKDTQDNDEIVIDTEGETN
jgi:CRISPR-associated protein Csh1